MPQGKPEIVSEAIPARMWQTHILKEVWRKDKVEQQEDRQEADEGGLVDVMIQ